MLSASGRAQTPETLEITDARIRTAPPGVPLAGYMTVYNRSNQSRTLIGATATGFASSTLHRTENHHGVVKMVPLPDLEIAAGEHISLAPGGLHLMLQQPQQNLMPGDLVPIELLFADAPRQSVMFRVLDTFLEDKPQTHNHTDH